MMCAQFSGYLQTTKNKKDKTNSYLGFVQFVNFHTTTIISCCGILFIGKCSQLGIIYDLKKVKLSLVS